MAKTKREPVKASSTWVCLVCPGNPEFDHIPMMEHLRNVHHIDTKHAKAKRSMLMHVDGDDFFASTFEWEINGMKFGQTTTNPRDKSDIMSMNHC